MDFGGKSDLDIAALAVREQSLQIVEQGLMELFRSTAVEDYRDVVSSLVLYYDALARIGVEPQSFLENHAKGDALSTKHIETFIARTTDLKSLESGGYKVVHDPDFRYEYNWR